MTYKHLWVALKHPLETAMCTLMVSLVIIIFAQVVTRYVLHVSLSWSEELARYLMLWLAMLSAAYGFKIKSHFALLFIVDKIPTKLRKITSAIGSVLVCALLCIFIVKSVEITYSVRNQVGPATGLSKSVPYASAIFGGVLMLYYVALNGWRDWRDHNDNDQGVN